MSTKTTAFGYAAAAALVALSGATLSGSAFAKDSDSVHCYGVNGCKGTSDCKSFNHDCKGQNSCKGQGFKALSEKTCAEQGGSTTEPKH